MRPEWSEKLDALTGERRQAMAFLRDSLPVSDLDCYSFDFFLTCADHALQVRQEFAWCAQLEEEIFYHYVLCPRVNDEDLGEYHACFYRALQPRVTGLFPEAAALEVNRWCHEWASYESQDDRTAAPLTVLRNGSGRCGEESAFLTAALRSVGLPARQIYAPWWSHCDDNHAWVEVLCGGVWHFLGACEPEPVLDRGWFNTAASRAMVVHSRIFGRGTSPLHGVPIGREGAVTWYNQTARYARTAEYRFSVRWQGAPAPGARLHLQLLNEAGFHTVAILTADGCGKAEISLGLGSLHVLAEWNGLWAEEDCTGEGCTLMLSDAFCPEEEWVEWNYCAPKDAPIHPSTLTQIQKTERAAVLALGTAIRESRLSAHFDPLRGAALPEMEEALLRSARGNFDEIYAFLSGKNRESRARLLATLAEKDLRDTDCETLEDLFHLPSAGELPEEIYWRYVACPRIAWEKLTSWRGPLSQWLAGLEERFRTRPGLLWGELRRHIAAPQGDCYANLYWTPAVAVKRGRCDEKSLRVLFVTLLRTLGIAARLRPTDGVPEFWENGRFRTVAEEETGPLRLVRTQGQIPLYRQNWTLSCWTEMGWRQLNLRDEDWNREIYCLNLPVGGYRIITAVRLPNGSQFAARRDFILSGQGQTIPLCLRTFALADMLGEQDMPPLPAVTLTGEPVGDGRHTSGKPALLFWLEEGSEPTEHILNELTDRQEAFRALPADIKFFVRSAESVKQPTLARVLHKWPEIQVLMDEWSFDLEEVARRLGCDPDRPPLAVVCSKAGQAVYGRSGYYVGTVELLARILEYLCFK